MPIPVNLPVLTPSRSLSSSAYLEIVLFEFNDGGKLFPKNYNVKTDSIEVIVSQLISAGVQQRAENNTITYTSKPE